MQDVGLVRRGVIQTGTLHLTTHHLIFRHETNEIWLAYPIISGCTRYAPSQAGITALRIRCRDFTFMALHFSLDAEARDVFDCIMKLSCLYSVERLYAYEFRPGPTEKKFNGWDLYDTAREFRRQGLHADGKSPWRMTTLNAAYSLCPTYPAHLMVPSTISDNVINYATKYRSKGRIPTLTYYHKLNSCTLTRSAQPLAGLKQTRSIQDEKLVAAIFASHQVGQTDVSAKVYGAQQENLIIDARPTANAFAQTALGAGTENVENYEDAKKIYLGVENIHVMRESLGKVIDAIKDCDLIPLPPSAELLHKSGWLKHISNLLEGAVLIARQIHFSHSHVLLHCSDGWDRTSQLASLAQICLDPFFRTIDGLIILVEKDWLSFGHRFADRCGYLASEAQFVVEAENGLAQVREKMFKTGGSSGAPRETSPVFHQFLDCVYQIMVQFSTRFEYTQRFLRRLLYHVYACQYGTFLFNSENERVMAGVRTQTRSVWSHFLAQRKAFLNPQYDPAVDAVDRGAEMVLQPDAKRVRWWADLFNRGEHEMNGGSSRNRVEKQEMEMR